MLYIHISPKSWRNGEFSIFGERDRERNGVRREDRLNTEVIPDYLSFSRLPKMYGEPFPSFELLGEKLIGFVRCPGWAISERCGAWSGDDALPEMVTFYVKYKVQTPFELWVKQNPLIRNSGIAKYRYLPALFFSEDGKWWLYYFLGTERKLQKEEITQSCFIRNGVVTTLEEAMARHKKALEDNLSRALQRHDKLREDPADMGDALDQEALLQFISS